MSIVGARPRHDPKNPGEPLPVVSRNASDLPVNAKGRRRKVYTLPLERMRPSIRIAHRLKGPLNVPERIILDHELVLILSGEGELRFNSRKIAFKANQLLFIPPFERHAFTSGAAEVEHVAVHFDLASEVPALTANLTRRRPYAVHFARGAALPRSHSLRPGDPMRSWLSNIVTFFALAQPLSRLRADALLLNVLASLLDSRPGSEAVALDAARRQRLTQPLDFVEKNFARRLAACDLARAAGMSTSHFNRVFRQWTGLPLGEYVLRRRVEEARKLLGDVRLSIKEIAAQCGFEDPYYFSRVFRRIDGVPPTHFRQALFAGRP